MQKIIIYFLTNSKIPKVPTSEFFIIIFISYMTYHSGRAKCHTAPQWTNVQCVCVCVFECVCVWVCVCVCVCVTESFVMVSPTRLFYVRGGWMNNVSFLKAPLDVATCEEKSLPLPLIPPFSSPSSHLQKYIAPLHWWSCKISYLSTAGGGGGGGGWKVAGKIRNL